MAILKVHELEGTPLIINMANVDVVRSDGAGHAVFTFAGDGVAKSRESFEEVESMLQVAATGYQGVVSRYDMRAVVR